MNKQIWSLWEIVNLFKAEKLAGLCAQFQLLMEGAQVGITVMGYGAHKPDDLRLNMLSRLVANTKQLCAEINLPDTDQQLRLAEYHLVTDTNSLTLLVMHSELRRILETLIAELGKRKFLFISADRNGYLENENLFGEAVSNRFPLAKADLRAAGNCLAAECWTAAVFHLMRSFEWALRTICYELGLKRMRDFDKKTGGFKYTPTSYAVWEKIINQLPAKVEKRLRELRPGPRKQRMQEYYSSAIEDVKAVKDAWRNHIMHTRQEFNRVDAAGVVSHVNSIMVRLSKRAEKAAITHA